MNVKINFTATLPATGKRVGHQSLTGPEALLGEWIDDLLASQCEHHPDVRARERPVVQITIEFVDAA
jgi:hypothetical protein